MTANVGLKLSVADTTIKSDGPSYLVQFTDKIV